MRPGLHNGGTVAAVSGELNQINQTAELTRPVHGAVRGAVADYRDIDVRHRRIFQNALPRVETALDGALNTLLLVEGRDGDQKFHAEAIQVTSEESGSFRSPRDSEDLAKPTKVYVAK